MRKQAFAMETSANRQQHPLGDVVVDKIHGAVYLINNKEGDKQQRKDDRGVREQRADELHGVAPSFPALFCFGDIKNVAVAPAPGGRLVVYRAVKG